MGKAKKGSVGTCKLCLQPGKLQRSHLLPAAAYRVCRSPLLKNPNPILVTRKGFVSTSLQSWAHLLCDKCEKQLNDSGEREVFTWLNNGKEFRLLDRLNLAHPDMAFRSLGVFSGARIGVDTDPFVHIATSVIWRAAMSGGWGVGLGAHEPLIRQYLLRSPRIAV